MARLEKHGPEPALRCSGCGDGIYPGELYCALPCGAYCRACLRLFGRLAGEER